MFVPREEVVVEASRVQVLRFQCQAVYHKVEGVDYTANLGLVDNKGLSSVLMATVFLI
jgi:hypothetical protein